jgi:hypothetical protein
MKIVAWFFILVALLIIAQWSVSLVMGGVPEVRTEPIRLAFHLAAEFFTALSLLVSGIALVQGKVWGRGLGLFAAGMLAYTVIVSPGYFAQHGQWLLLGMFIIVLVLDLVSFCRLRVIQ